MVDPRSPRRLLALRVLAVFSLLVAACGNTNPTPAPTAVPSATVSPSSSPTPAASTPAPSSSAEDVDAILDAIERQVIQIRGLDSSVALDREIIDEAKLRELITADFDKESPPAKLEAAARVDKALGLLAADADLRALSLDMLSAGVAGFYKDDEKKMYIVSRGAGGLTAADRITYAHEFTHALQDQHWTVFKDTRAVADDSDRLLARQAIFEGDASLVMFTWARANLSAAEIAEVSKVDPASQAIVTGMPAIMRDPLLFPYSSGLFFVLGAQTSGGWPAVDAFYDRMPASTEQILHPEAYTKGDAPVAIQLPTSLASDLGAGWSVPLQDTFGELQMGIWLREDGVPKTDADAAAAGWGGDRLAVVEGPDGAWALAMATVWDTSADAKAFEAAATTALAKAGGVGQVLPGAGGTTRWVVIADRATTLDKVAGVLGLAG